MPDSIDPNLITNAMRNWQYGPDMGQVTAMWKMRQQQEQQQQQQAGMNALRTLYANQSNIDPVTHMLRPEAMGSLFQINPAMGMDYMNTLNRTLEEQQRLRQEQQGTMWKYNELLDKQVASPALQKYNELVADKKLTPQEVQQQMQGFVQNLRDTTQKEYGVPDEVMNKFPSWDEQAPTTWPLRSAAFQARQAAIKKGWMDAGYATLPSGETVKIQHNDLLNQTRNALTEELIPSGTKLSLTAGPSAGRENKLYTDSTGTTFHLSPEGKPVTLGDNAPYTPKGAIRGIGTGTTDTKPMAAPLEAEIKDPKTGKTELRPVRQYQTPDGGIETRDATNNQVIPPDQVGQIRPASAARPRSAATAYITKFMEENPNATADEVADAAAKFSAQQGGTRYFLGGGQGGVAVRSLGTVVGDHLPTLETLVSGLENNDVQILNRVKNRLRTEFGWTGATNFESARAILSGEIVKAIQGYAGAEADRDRFLQQLSTYRTPEQLRGMIYVIKSLLAGQLRGLYRQAQAGNVSDEQFMKLLPESARGLMNEFRSGSMGDSGGGGTTTDIAPPIARPEIGPQGGQPPGRNVIPEYTEVPIPQGIAPPSAKEFAGVTNEAKTKDGKHYFVLRPNGTVIYVGMQVKKGGQ